MIHARELDERNDAPRPVPTGCACFPNGDAPGYCPGRDRCPRGPMIRALLAGTKTQTRCAMKPQPDLTPELNDHAEAEFYVGDECVHISPCPYGAPGDLLWVREACRADEDDAGLDGVWFAADGAVVPIENTVEAADRWVVLNHYGDTSGGRGNLVPSIHMPRWASRLTLRITDVRVERLHDISDADAEAEGILRDHESDAGMPGCVYCNGSGWVSGMPQKVDTECACVIGGRQGFRALWAWINGIASWDANPWVWVISFETIKANVDAVIAQQAAA